VLLQCNFQLHSEIDCNALSVGVATEVKRTAISLYNMERDRVFHKLIDFYPFTVETLLLANVNLLSYEIIINNDKKNPHRGSEIH
jgi:hypothetical protein